MRWCLILGEFGLLEPSMYCFVNFCFCRLCFYCFNFSTALANGFGRPLVDVRNNLISLCEMHLRKGSALAYIAVETPITYESHALIGDYENAAHC